jgi:tetratricopeptide (TPR) repeat protein
VALTDPELDLLREVLEENPGDGAFLEVGRELVRRASWGDAVAVLTAALDVHGENREGWSLLAHAATAGGRFEQALAAFARLGPDLARDPDLARLHVVALEGAGRHVEARAVAESLSGADRPTERTRGPRRSGNPAEPARNAVGPARSGSAVEPARSPVVLDPLVTRERAEAYVAIGRPDRAIRTFRRLLYRDPTRADVKQRLRELLEKPREEGTDDLSDELPPPSIAPPLLQMPSPYSDDDEITLPAIDIEALRRQIDEANAAPLPAAESPDGARRWGDLPGVREVAQELASECTSDSPSADDETVTLDASTPFGPVREFARQRDDPTKRRTIVKRP